jgi:hypothetical protein
MHRETVLRNPETGAMNDPSTGRRFQENYEAQE